MIKQIRTSKVTRVVSCYLALMIILEMLQPMVAYALTGGPGQPEFQAFTPIGTSDMVDLSSGDFNYNIPVMDVGGYPLNLAYNSGVTMDQEASWVGLGWDLNVGQISRNMRGIPDDFKGDKMIYENNMKPNTTVGGNVNIFISPFGALENLISVGMGVKYNNYNGFGFSINGGLSYQVSDNLSVGMNLESSSDEGVTVSPSVSMHGKYSDKSKTEHTLGGSLGVSMNSRKGVESVTMSATQSAQDKTKGPKEEGGQKRSGSIGGGSLSLVDASFTPTKRVGMSSSNVMFSVNIEGAVFGIDPGVKFSGYRNTQGIKDSEKYKEESAYGYQHTTSATVRDVTDFNREKDRTVTKNTVALPVTSYTYDLYSIQGQGVGGQFRPYRSQVGYIFDNYTQDDSFGSSLGGEIGAGAGTHFGFDGAVTDSESSTGLWTSGNAALYRVLEKTSGNKPNYEKVFFKNIGGLTVDREKDQGTNGVELFKDALGNYDPITFKINGGRFGRGLDAMYYNKFINQTKPLYSNALPLARNKYRLSRTQFIQALTRKEATRFGFKTKFSPYSKKGKHDHHTSEIRVLKDGGEHYIYGRAAYNSLKREVTFDVGTTPDGNCKTGLVSYGPSDNTPGNNQSGDRYFNRITTPAYAHTYLLTSVLSSDYQDISNNGPTDDDLGSYTKFSYTSKNKTIPYKWRVPYDEFKANYDEGLRSSKKDNKGNYQYGEKELLYINKIETKTHVAIFTISARKDGYGVKGENGGADNSEPSKMWKLDKISLYSKPEYIANPEGALPIKEAHFVYDYALCPGVKNNLGETATSPTELANQGGKLTLKKMYFTYRDSNMGKYTPYSFNYDQSTNYAYDQKGYDLWGNYKPTNPAVGCGTNDPLSNAEYPYVEQSKSSADKCANAWLLHSIDLPSGGQLEVKYESDEYQYVQDRKAMRMFKIVGLGNNPSPNPSNFSNQVYGKHYAYVKLDGGNPLEINGSGNKAKYFQNYLKDLDDKPVYFRCLLNMTDPNVENDDKYDYVTGYLDLENAQANADVHYDTATASWYGSVPVKFVNATGSIGDISPFTKAGFFFGRQYLNNVVYSLTGNEDVNNIKGVVMSLATLVPNLLNIFRSADGQLIDKHIASRMVLGKSWMRLMHPMQRKFGGGSRVKELKVHDRWDVMTNHLGEEVYKQFYGQIYSYDKEDGSTSGVATYEPLSGKENPFVEPFYDHAHRKVLLGPDTQNYVELPLGESFYPSPKITYSRVTVKNLPRSKNNSQSAEKIVVKKHATGQIVNEFYTSYDYPTVSDKTIMDSEFDPSPLGSILNIYARTHLSMAQGFTIHTNDMDGKQKAQWVYAEGQTTPISGMEYKYDNSTTTPNAGKLNNEVTIIDRGGKIGKAIVGVDYDVVNDFRENNSTTETAGVHFNTEGLPLLLVFVIVPVPIPSYSYHENVLRTAVTTKVIHSTAILRETVAYDLGSKVSTRNLAWDAETGDILLTETINEYNDKYFSFKFPAYWAYKGMGQASNNLGLEWKMKVSAGPLQFRLDNAVASDYLGEGDVLYVTSRINKKGFKAWVVNLNGNTFRLINNRGLRIPVESIPSEGADIKVIRSSFRNLPSAPMASVTSMRNPLYHYNADNIATTVKDSIGNRPYLAGNWEDYRIVNASAVEYLDVWPTQCECGLPKMKFDEHHNPVFEFNNTESTDDSDIIADKSYNPYLYNVLGNWRAVRNYAYLTGRSLGSKPTPRRDGFFMDFAPYYRYSNADGRWIKDPQSENQWTFASEISKYNAYGQEIENRDALNRYSSAMYGYNNRFAVAVSANAKSSEQAYDGFEDYDFSECTQNTHFSFKEKLKAHKISITKKESHTGRNSIRVEPGLKTSDTISIRKKVTQCQDTVANPQTRPSARKVKAPAATTIKKAPAKIKTAASKATVHNGTTKMNKK